MRKLCVYLEVRLVTAELDILTKLIVEWITTNSTVAQIRANCDLHYNIALQTTNYIPSIKTF